jgi:hypothetical protein
MLDAPACMKGARAHQIPAALQVSQSSVASVKLKHARARSAVEL